MKMKIIIPLIFISNIVFGQDPSFSQFDLNMMYTNPAYASYEGGTRILLHSRNQWNRINENFNNSLLELSSRMVLNRNNRKLKSSWCYGINILSEDLEAFPEIGNSVFLNKQEITLMPFTLELKISNNSYISAAPLNVSFRKYDLIWDDMLFSDMLDDYGNIFNTTSFNPDLFVHENWIGDLSYGLIYTMHGKYSNNQANRFNLGFASHHALQPVESFSNNNTNSSKIPIRLTIHSEFYSAIPLNVSTRPFIPYYRALIKHERYIKDGNMLMSKTEIGGTMFINNTPLEVGSLFRLNKNTQDKNTFQSWIPIIRYRINQGRHLYVISYSYDLNIATQNSITLSASGTTHEIGFSMYLFSGWGGNKDCAAFKQMDNNPLYQDIMKNGLLRK